MTCPSMFQLGKEHPPTKKEKEKKVQVAKFIYFTSNNIFQWEKRDPYRELKKKKDFEKETKINFHCTTLVQIINKK